MLSERLPVGGSRIAFMPIETIVGPACVGLNHLAVPGHFGENRGCRDIERPRIPFDDRALIDAGR